jgi:hypothetical protein
MVLRLGKFVLIWIQGSMLLVPGANECAIFGINSGNFRMIIQVQGSALIEGKGSGQAK